MRNVAIVVIAIFVIILAGWVAIRSQERKQECLDSGGWINEYNCGENGCMNWSCIHD